MITPLRGIASVTSTIKEEYEEKLNKQGIEWLGNILERTHYMESLIEGMLEYAHITRADLSQHSFSPKNLIDQVMEVNEASDRVKLNLNVPSATINHYESVGRSIFHNLISNTLKYSNQEVPEISISLMKKKGELCLDFKDNGPGIPEDQREKVFKLF